MAISIQTVSLEITPSCSTRPHMAMGVENDSIITPSGDLSKVVNCSMYVQAKLILKAAASYFTAFARSPER